MLRTCYLFVRRFAPAPALSWIVRLENSPSGLRLASGVFWSAVGAVLSRLLALAATIVIARILGKVVFGEFSMIQSTLNMFATFATFGVGLAVTKYVAESRERNRERAGRIIAMSYVLALVSGFTGAAIMFLGAPLLAKKFLSAPHLAGMIALCSLALLFQVVNEVQIGALSGLEAFRRRSTLQTYGAIAAFPISVIAVHFFGLAGAVYALALAGGVLVLLNALGIHKEATLAGISFRWQGLSSEMGLVWRFNLPSILSGSVYVPSMWVANLLLVNGPDGYAQMGLFSAADRWRTAIGFLPALLGGVALPMLSNISGTSDIRQFQKLMWINVFISSIFSLAVAIPIAALAPWIMRSYGTSFIEGKWVLVILCASAVIQAGYWIICQSLVAKDRIWTMFRINLGWALLFLGTAWLLRIHGALGLAASYLLADVYRLLAGLIVSRGTYPHQQTETAAPAALISDVGNS